MSADKTVLVSTPTFGKYSQESRDRLREYGCEFVELSREEAADRDVLFDHLDGVHAWVVGYTEIDAATFDRASELEVVAKHGTGVDNVDLDAAEDRGVVVANAPGANANAVAATRPSGTAAGRATSGVNSRAGRSGSSAWERSARLSSTEPVDSTWSTWHTTSPTGRRSWPTTTSRWSTTSTTCWAGRTS